MAVENDKSFLIELVRRVKVLNALLGRHYEGYRCIVFDYPHSGDIGFKIFKDSENYMVMSFSVMLGVFRNYSTKRYGSFKDDPCWFDIDMVTVILDELVMLVESNDMSIRSVSFVVGRKNFSKVISHISCRKFSFEEEKDIYVE